MQETNLTILKNFLKKSTPSYTPCNLIQTSVDSNEYHLYYIQKHLVNQIALPKNKDFSSAKTIEYNNIVHTVENTNLQPVKLQPISRVIVFVREELQQEIMAYARENTLTVINITNEYQLEERITLESNITSIAHFEQSILVGLQNGQCLRISKEGPEILYKKEAEIRFLVAVQQTCIGITKTNFCFTISSDFSVTDEEKKIFKDEEEEDFITCVATLLNSNRILLTTSYGMLFVFNEKMELECQVSIHLRWITCLDVLEDRIATCSEDGYIHVLQYKDSSLQWLASEQIKHNYPVGLRFLKRNCVVAICYEQEDLYMVHF